MVKVSIRLHLPTKHSAIQSIQADISNGVRLIVCDLFSTLQYEGKQEKYAMSATIGVIYLLSHCYL